MSENTTSAMVTRTLEEHEARLRAIEEWRTINTTILAVREERDKHLDKRFDQIEASVDEVKNYLLKIVWAIVIGIIGAIMTFVINGGLISKL